MAAVGHKGTYKGAKRKWKNPLFKKCLSLEIDQIDQEFRIRCQLEVKLKIKKGKGTQVEDGKPVSSCNCGIRMRSTWLSISDKTSTICCAYCRMSNKYIIIQYNTIKFLER